MCVLSGTYNICSYFIIWHNEIKYCAGNLNSKSFEITKDLNNEITNKVSWYVKTYKLWCEEYLIFLVLLINYVGSQLSNQLKINVEKF